VFASPLRKYSLLKFPEHCIQKMKETSYVKNLIFSRLDLFCLIHRKWNWSVSKIILSWEVTSNSPVECFIYILYIAVSFITFFHILLVPFFIIVYLVVFCILLFNFVNYVFIVMFICPCYVCSVLSIPFHFVVLCIVFV
jgi:hypothetical protein